MATSRASAAPRLNRRAFLGSSLAASVALMVKDAPAAPAAKTGYKLPHNPRTAAAMPMRNFGRTGYRVGMFSLGCQAAIEIDGNAKLAADILHRALDVGVNYFDTARAYGKGISETHLGPVIKERRSEVFLATKTGKRDRDGALKELDVSLKLLQTDHIDTWQLHNVQRIEEVNKIFAADGAIHAFEQARAEGRVRFLGITGHFDPDVLLAAVKRYNFDTILMAVNAADRHYLSFIEHLLPACLERNMGIIGMKLATRGRLLSSWQPEPLDKQPERMRTAKTGTLTMKESLYYNSTLPLSTNIVGVDTVAQLEENVRWSADFTPLSDSQMRALEKRTLPIVRQALYFRRWDLGA
jgi:predicted aldo/keto reductase-like oxidoreductase